MKSRTFCKSFLNIDLGIRLHAILTLEACLLHYLPHQLCIVNQHHCHHLTKYIAVNSIRVETLQGVKTGADFDLRKYGLNILQTD